LKKVGDKMKKFMFCLLCAISLFACKKNSEESVLHCGAYDVQIGITDDGNKMHANINGDVADLVLVPSASGAKYSGVLNDIVVVLWQKGENWTMLLDDEEIIDCRAK